MRALLTPEVVPRLGVVLLKPGSELFSLFTGGRVLVERQPEHMAGMPTGRVPDARQPLAENKSLQSFFSDARVIQAAGGINALEEWLLRRFKKCQYPHGDYHHNEVVTMRYASSAIAVCWHCDHTLKDQATETLGALALNNATEWVIDRVLLGLGYNKERELSLGELCWWAIYSGIGVSITEGMAHQALRLPVEPFLSVYKEADIIPGDPVPSAVQLQQRARRFKRTEAPEPVEQKPVMALQADPDSPESFMLRPKRRRWENEKYTRWVKSQPCECCRRPADDPHHIIGNGMGGTATKAHDLFVIPLCRECHDKLHADVAAFEQKNGTQLELLFRFLDRALAIGVIVKA